MVGQYDNLVSSTLTVVPPMVHGFHNGKELLLTCIILGLSI